MITVVEFIENKEKKLINISFMMNLFLEILSLFILTDPFISLN